MLHLTIIISKAPGSGEEPVMGHMISRNGEEIIKIKNISTGGVEFIKAGELSPFEHRLLLPVRTDGAEEEFIISDITMRPGVRQDL